MVAIGCRRCCECEASPGSRTAKTPRDPRVAGLHALREPDDVALGVGEHGELDRAVLRRRHDRSAAGLLDLGERALEVLGLDVEGDQALAIARLADAAADAVVLA